MAYCFGDGFDCYAAPGDAVLGYWDSGTAAFALSVGRISGQSIQRVTASSTYLVKSSGVNDAVHHINVAFYQNAALSGVLLGLAFNLVDGVTTQCSIVFRSDGAMLLTSGGTTGTVLDTYAGAVSVQSAWVSFEIEVVVNGTTGSWAVRKNGNTVNDRALGGLNTRTSANNYANKLQIGASTGTIANQFFDDVLWRSDAASVPWVGDIRAYTRMPSADASVQFARAPATITQPANAGGSSAINSIGTARYASFVPTNSGTIGTVTLPFAIAFTGNMKCSFFASSGSGPTSVLGSATPVALSSALLATFTFSTPVSVVKGTQYWIGFAPDATSGQMTATGAATGLASTTTYANFPLVSPTTANDRAPTASSVISTTVNADFVSEAQQDGTSTYVYDAVAGHADFYNVAPLTPAPASVVAVTTRGFVVKGDAGTRSGAVQLRSGGTTVAAPTVALSTSFGWSWRTDTTNPAGGAWTAAAVDAAQIGPLVVS